jgi:hypothetical protein
VSARIFVLDDEWPWAMWTAGADWLLWPMLERWLVTGDDRYLAGQLAPWLIEIARFYRTSLASIPGQVIELRCVGPGRVSVVGT